MTDDRTVTVSADPGRVDVDVVWEFLSTAAYWGRWRAREDVVAQVRDAWRVVGAYASDGSMVGFARAFSDGRSTAYLADVFVVADRRGAGVARELLEEMIDRGPGREFRWMLHTADAHPLYEQFGFRPPDGSYLERSGVRPLTRWSGEIGLPMWATSQPATTKARASWCPASWRVAPQ